MMWWMLACTIHADDALKRGHRAQPVLGNAALGVGELT